MRLMACVDMIALPVCALTAVCSAAKLSQPGGREDNLDLGRRERRPRSRRGDWHECSNASPCLAEIGLNLKAKFWRIAGHHRAPAGNPSCFA